MDTFGYMGIFTSYMKFRQQAFIYFLILIFAVTKATSELKQLYDSVDAFLFLFLFCFCFYSVISFNYASK